MSFHKIMNKTVIGLLFTGPYGAFWNLMDMDKFGDFAAVPIGTIKFKKKSLFLLLGIVDCLDNLVI